MDQTGNPLASLMIAWGAECSQFFVAQGLALAILAWVQTLQDLRLRRFPAITTRRNACWPI